jgi:hypothetical protein
MAHPRIPTSSVKWSRSSLRTPTCYEQLGGNAFRPSPESQVAFNERALVVAIGQRPQEVDVERSILVINREGHRGVESTPADRRRGLPKPRAERIGELAAGHACRNCGVDRSGKGE